MRGDQDQQASAEQAPKLKLVGGEPQRITPQRAAGPLRGPQRRTADRPDAIDMMAAADAAIIAPTSEARPTRPAVTTTPMRADDPRWVLALRVAESLQGTTLPPERRRKLIRMGKVFGLTDFDANLIIAIVQDQARRGYRPEVCPRMGEAQLRMVPPPPPARSLMGPTRLRRWTTVGLIVVGFMALEWCLLWMWLR